MVNTPSKLNPFPPVSANWHLFRFYSVQRQTILLVNREPLRVERVNPIIQGVPATEVCLQKILKYQLEDDVCREVA